MTTIIDASKSPFTIIDNGENAPEAVRQAGIATTAATAAGVSAASAAAMQVSVLAISASVGSYKTKADALTALAASQIPLNSIAQVRVDETQGNRWTFYKNVAGTLVFENAVFGDAEWFVRPPLSSGASPGNDSNPGTRAAPFATYAKAKSMAVAGDTIWLWPHGVFKENLSYTDTPLADGVAVKVIGGCKAIWQCMDVLAGSWTASGNHWYIDVTHLFGGSGVKVGASRLYPTAQPRLPVTRELTQLNTYYRNEFASDAAGIAFLDATPGAEYLEDLSGSGSSYTAGWQAGGPFRYHVRMLGDVDPNTCEWMVKQRQAPGFGRYNELVGLTIFGNIHHDGLVMKTGNIDNVELAWTANHAAEIPGCTVDRLTIRDSSARQTPYAIHQFAVETDWLMQQQTTHRRTRVINWAGPVLGGHGTGAADGGGGAGMTTAMVTFEDFYCENVKTLGGQGGASVGVTFNNPVFNGIGSLGSSHACNITINNMRAVQREMNGVGVSYTNGVENFMFTPAAGKTLTINGGSAAVYVSAPIRGAGGRLKINGFRCIYGRSGATMINRTGTFEGIDISKSIFQYDSGGDGNGSAALSAASSPNADSPVTITESHISGHDFSTIPAGWTIDAHTLLDGHAGLSYGDGVNEPVKTDKYSSWFSLGEKFIAASTGHFRENIMLTTKGTYAPLPATGSLDDARWLIPSTFTPRGVVAMWSTNNNVYIYGNGGKIYKGVYTAPTVFNEIASGSTANFVAHLSIGALVFLLGDAGEVVKLDTATDTFTAQTSGQTWRMRGGMAIDATNFILFGSNDANTVGGAIYTTDGGTTWTAHATLTSTALKQGAVVNGFLVAMGDNRAFWTATVAGGVAAAFTNRNGVLQGHVAIRNMAVDATGKRLLWTGPMGAAYANNRGSRMGWIDCTDAANPALWKVKSIKPPMPTVRAVLFNTQANDGFNYSYASWFGPGCGPIAWHEGVDATDFAMNVAHRSREGKLAASTDSDNFAWRWAL